MGRLVVVVGLAVDGVGVVHCVDVTDLVDVNVDGVVDVVVVVVVVVVDAVTGCCVWLQCRVQQWYVMTVARTPH